MRGARWPRRLVFSGLAGRKFKEVIYPPQRVWMHHLEVHESDDIDDEVVAWLREACEQAG